MGIQRSFERHQFRANGINPPSVLDKINDRLSEKSEAAMNGGIVNIHPTKGYRFYSAGRLRAMQKHAELKSRLAGNFARV